MGKGAGAYASVSRRSRIQKCACARGFWRRCWRWGAWAGWSVRLFVLMLRDPGGYAARAADQQLRGATLPAARGEIYSADGTLLAASETCWTIRAAPREMADDKVEPAARALSEILELDYDDTLAKFSQRSSNDCLLRRRVDKDMADAVRDWCTANGVDGVQIRQDTKRVYPEGDFMGGILGFTDVDNAGLWGLGTALQRRIDRAERAHPDRQERLGLRYADALPDAGGRRARQHADADHRREHSALARKRPVRRRDRSIMWPSAASAS